MKKIKLIAVFTLIIIGCTTTNSICLDNQYNYGNDIWINNMSDNDLKVTIENVDLRKEEINVGKNYDASAIITMKVSNNGKYDVELSNIDIYPYQGGKETKYFVSTGKENITGFIGNIKSGESTTIKMGVTLFNAIDPIKLEMTNIEDITNEKVVKTINIK